MEDTKEKRKRNKMTEKEKENRMNKKQRNNGIQTKPSKPELIQNKVRILKKRVHIQDRNRERKARQLVSIDSNDFDVQQQFGDVQSAEAGE